MLLSIGLLAKLHDKSTIKGGRVTYFPCFILLMLQWQR